MNTDDFVTEGFALQGDAEIVGLVEPKSPTNNEVSLWGINGQRYLCSNCRGSSTKGARHNQYEDDKVCKKNGCKCFCQSHYLGRDGRTLMQWGKEDMSQVESVEFKRKPNQKLDKLIQKLNLEHSKLKDLGIIFAHKICTRCGIKGRFEGWACKPCKKELSEENLVSFNKV